MDRVTPEMQRSQEKEPKKAAKAPKAKAKRAAPEGAASVAKMPKVAVDPSKALEELLAGLQEPGWKDKSRHGGGEALAAEFDKKYFADIAHFVQEERAALTVHPPVDKVFSAFNETPFEQVRVVILGQDPYHEPGQAHGMCFSELETDIPGFQIPEHGFLLRWAQQGVLLLNATLTVREGHKEANSHAKCGWQTFTDEVIRALNEKREGVVFLLWGNFAKQKAWCPMVRTMYGAGKLQRTPEEVERSCTDCCCLITYLAVCTGLVACIWQAFEKGDIHRLTSLPDYQGPTREIFDGMARMTGTQCVDKYIFFPENFPVGTTGINLHRHVCVDYCPTNSSSLVTYLIPHVVPEEEGRRHGRSWGDVRHKRLKRKLVGLLEAAEKSESAASAGMAETNSLLMAPTAAPAKETAEPAQAQPPQPAPQAAPAATPAPAASPAPAQPAQPAQPIWSPNAPTMAPMSINDAEKMEGARWLK
eukprot:g12407.t1